MSFILDAIKKSERERQRSRQPDVHSLQDSAPQYTAPRSQSSRLLLLLVALLILGVMAYALWPRISQQFLSPSQPVPQQADVDPGVQGTAQNTAQQTNTTNSTSRLTEESVDTAIPSASKSGYQMDDELPPRNEIKELWQQPSDYQSTIPDLELSFHVFSYEPDKRYVIINGRRIREGQMVASGVKLRVITENGVIIFANGRFFHVDVIEQW